MTEWSIIWEARSAFLNGALNTLILFALSVLAAFVIGCFSVYLLEGRNWLSTLLRGAINLMRMLPFLVLAYLLYYGLPALGIKPSAWGAGLVALAPNLAWLVLYTAVVFIFAAKRLRQKVAL